jgi:hypothetical protein
MDFEVKNEWRKELLCIHFSENSQNNLIFSQTTLFSQDKKKTHELNCLQVTPSDKMWLFHLFIAKNSVY